MQGCGSALSTLVSLPRQISGKSLGLGGGGWLSTVAIDVFGLV